MHTRSQSLGKWGDERGLYNSCIQVFINAAGILQSVVQVQLLSKVLSTRAGVKGRMYIS